MNTHLAKQYGTSGLSAWIQNNVVTVLVIVIGVVLLMAAQKANVSKVISVFGLALLGILWLGLAASGNISSVGDFLVSLVSSA